MRLLLYANFKPVKTSLMSASIKYTLFYNIKLQVFLFLQYFTTKINIQPRYLATQMVILTLQHSKLTKPLDNPNHIGSGYGSFFPSPKHESTRPDKPDNIPPHA